MKRVFKQDESFHKILLIEECIVSNQALCCLRTSHTGPTGKHEAQHKEKKLVETKKKVVSTRFKSVFSPEFKSHILYVALMSDLFNTPFCQENFLISPEYHGFRCLQARQVDDSLEDMIDHPDIRESEEDELEKKRNDSETYYGLLEENVILLEQLKDKEEICSRLQKELEMLDKKVEVMNKHHTQETGEFLSFFCSLLKINC